MMHRLKSLEASIYSELDLHEATNAEAMYVAASILARLSVEGGQAERVAVNMEQLLQALKEGRPGAALDSLAVMAMEQCLCAECVQPRGQAEEAEPVLN